LKKNGRFLFLYVLVALFVLSVTGMAFAVEEKGKSAAPAFTDVSGDANAVYISYMARRGIISGFPDGTFHPAEGITRAQAAVLVTKISGLTGSTDVNGFTDVGSSHWAAGYINAAATAGYLKGFPDNTFRPEEKLSRAQGISLFMRLSKEDMGQAELPIISDMDNNHWAARPVAVALEAGMVGLSQDKNSFYPDQEFRRGDLARALGVLLTQDPELSRASLRANLKVKSGEVLVTRAGKEARSVSNSTNLNPGDMVTIGKGEAEIIFPDGTGLLLKDNTKLILKESQGRHYIKYDGSSGIAVDWLEVELLEGKLFGALASKYSENQEQGEATDNETAGLQEHRLLASRDNSFDLLAAASKGKQPWYQTAERKKVKVQVDMPWGVAAIRGSFWGNTVTSTGNSTSLLEGEAEVTSGGSTQTLSPMQSSTVGGQGQPPAPPLPMPPSQQREWLDNRQWVENRAQEIVNNQEAPRTPPPAPDVLSDPKQQQAPAPTPPAPPTNNLPSAITNALSQAAQGASSTGSPSSSSGSSGGSSDPSDPSTPITGTLMGSFSLQNAAVVNVAGQSVVLTQEFGVSPAASLNATDYELLVKNGANYNYISARIPVTQKVRYLAKLFEQPENLIVKLYQQNQNSPVGVANLNGSSLVNLANKTIAGTISLESGVAPAGGITANIYVTGDYSYEFSNFRQQVTIPAGASSAAYVLSVPDNRDAQNGYWVRYSLNGTFSQPYLLQGSYPSRVSVISGNQANINLTIGQGQVVSGRVVLPAPNNSGRNIYISISASGNKSSSTTVSFANGQQEATYSLVAPPGDYRISYYINDSEFWMNNHYMQQAYYKSSNETVGEYNQAAAVTVGTGALSGIDLNVVHGGYYISGSISLPTTASRDIEVYVGAQDMTVYPQTSIYYTVLTISAGQISSNYNIFVDEYSTKQYKVGYSIRDGSFCKDNSLLCSGYYSTTGMVDTPIGATVFTVDCYGKENINLGVILGGVLISGNLSMPSGQLAPSGGLDVIIHATNQSDARYSTAITIPAGASSAAYNLLVPGVSCNYTFYSQIPEYNTYQPNLATLAFTGAATSFDLTLQPVSQSGAGRGGSSGGISPDSIANHSVLVCGKAFNINSSEYNSTNIAEVAGTCGGLYYKSALANTAGMWFDLLDPSAVSEVYFSNPGNAVLPLVLGGIWAYAGGTYLNVGPNDIVVPAGWIHTRSCQVIPTDATLEVVAAPDPNIAGFEILSNTGGQRDIRVTANSPGTTSVSLKASKDGLTYEKAVPIRVIPILTISPVSLTEGYTAATMTVSESMYGDFQWIAGDSLQLQLIWEESATPIPNIIMPSVTAGETDFTFTLPTGLVPGGYGLLVDKLIEGVVTTIGVALFTVNAPGNPAVITGATYYIGGGELNIATSGVISGSTFELSSLILKGASSEYPITVSDVSSSSFTDDIGNPQLGTWRVQLTQAAMDAINNMTGPYYLDAAEGWNIANDNAAAEDLNNPISFLP